ncbi:hypothetical protein HID58_005069, partial [Brassica napus]
MGIKVSRARWFIFLRESLSVITFTLAISRGENPSWLVRLWITNSQSHVVVWPLSPTRPLRFVFGDIEQQHRKHNVARVFLYDFVCNCECL